MDVLFDSDKAGIVLGLFVFLIMILIGLYGNLSPALVVARALVAFTIAYCLGFMLSRWITSALITTMAAERAKKLIGKPSSQKQADKKGAETQQEQRSS